MSGRAIAIAGMTNLAFRCSVVFRFIAMDKHSRKGSVQGRRERDEAFASSTVSSQLVSSRLLQSRSCVSIAFSVIAQLSGEKKKEWQCMPSGEGWLGERSLLYSTVPNQLTRGCLGN